nr:glycosyltransferase family 1 protein [uncultured Desulfobacter sp.]
MRVLINAFSARLGGGQTYLINLLNHIPDRSELEVVLAVPDDLKLSLPKTKITRLNPAFPVKNPILRALWEKVFLSRLLRKHKIDVLFSPGGVVSASIPKGCKSITMFRNMMPFDIVQRQKYPLGYMRMRNWILEKVMLNSMLRADLVIFISNYAHGVIEKKAKGRLKKTAIIPHGINPRFRIVSGNADCRPEWLPDKDYFLYVSILDVYKAQLELVRGYAKLKTKRPNLAKFILIGPDFTRYARLVREEIIALNLENDVLILGEIPYHELEAAYHHAQLIIFASECENCPNILLESLAAGKPMMVSNRPPMPEFGGNAVIYYDPTSPNDFAAKMDMVLAKPKLLKELAKRSSARSLNYNWQTSATLTWDHIAKIGG